MDTERLKYFVSAAQCLNFSEVARSNYVSQPTISHQIGLLEQELGTELFSRNGKTLQLNKEGEYFLPLANRILDIIEDATLELARFKQGKTGRVSIFVSETCHVAFQQCLMEFSKRYPEILLDTEVIFRGIKLDYLVSGNYDVFFTAEKIARNSDQLEYVVTHHDRLCLVLPEETPVPEDLNDFSCLKGMPFVSMSLNSYMMQNDIERVFLSRNYTPQAINRCNRMEDALLSVETGIGFSILPLSIVLLYSNRRVKYIPLEDRELLVNCVAAWRRNVARSTSAEAFIKVVKDIFTQK